MVAFGFFRYFGQYPVLYISLESATSIHRRVPTERRSCRRHTYWENERRSSDQSSSGPRLTEIVTSRARRRRRTDCLLALRSGKATGWDNIPIEAYRGSRGARDELFRICRLMWTTEQIPADLVRGIFVMLYLQERPTRRFLQLSSDMPAVPRLQAAVRCRGP